MKKKTLFLLFMCIFFIPVPLFSQAVKLPFYVYKDFNSPMNHGAPSGWMGDFRDVVINLNCQENPYSGTSCLEISYTAKGSKYAYWAGMTWQYPANNAGYIDGGLNFTGAKKVTFWARGSNGNEIVDAFLLGGTLGAYPDTDSMGIYQVRLKSEWNKYEIDLTDADVSYISALFCWVANRYSNPQGFTFYLDEIRIE
ncbi:MAG: hypothetical protein KAI43_10800 [Candidatus Aureabacteria bacterium]|nr:hypothetical protein [Candidatus Auribacterota bacterium]